ncbi:hypothetical protein WAI453_004099 [Rhynchosporium graminicola]
MDVSVAKVILEPMNKPDYSLPFEKGGRSCKTESKILIRSTGSQKRSYTEYDINPLTKISSKKSTNYRCSASESLSLQLLVQTINHVTSNHILTRHT